MSGNLKTSDLTHRQQAVLPVMAAAPSLAEAARISGFNERTLRRWLDDDDFRAELTRLRQESAETRPPRTPGTHAPWRLRPVRSHGRPR